MNTPSVLKKITDNILHKEKKNFNSFDKASFGLLRRSKPIDVISQMNKGFFLIAEAKKGSPSKGIIRERFDAVDLAVQYELSGASAVSVLTESDFFFGAKQYLVDVKAKVDIPVLRKDFIIHPYQVYESYNLGADIVLLIAACLSDVKLEALYYEIRSLGMTALIEVHNKEELNRVLKLNPELIGINNRDLNTFTVDIETSFRLKNLIPDSVKVISESGLGSVSEIKRLKENSFAGALIGESILRQNDVKQFIKELLI